MRTWFGAHMAGLTKTYQVAANICIFCGGELAERSDVVDRQTFANVLSAVSTIPLLFIHDNKADTLPVSTSICFCAANPIRGLFAGHMLGPKIRFTFYAAKIAGVAFVNFPLMFLKHFSALTTYKAKQWFPRGVGLSSHYGRFRIFLRVFSDLIHACGVLHAKAFTRTKSFSRDARWQNQHCGPTRFARLLCARCDHQKIVSQSLVRDALPLFGAKQ